MTESGQPSGLSIDTNQDRYPTLEGTLRRLLDEEVLANAVIERLELTAMANGEANYRFWTPRAEESDGGYLPPE